MGQMVQANSDLSRAAERRFEAYLDGIAVVLGHADRRAPARAYGTGLPLPGERKIGEPLASCNAPQRSTAVH